MSGLTDILERFKGADVERLLGLRPNYPPVVVTLDRHEVGLLRIKRRRGSRPLIEAHHVRTLDEAALPSSLFQTENGSADLDLGGSLRQLFEESGTRPGRVALVLPDNLAKISLLQLPEAPSSRKQLDQIVRFKMRRAVPFRLDEAALSYQVLDGAGSGSSVLVALVRRVWLDKYEKALESIGARPGLIDLCTPNLLNLCRDRLTKASKTGDTALLNCAGSYFSFIILRAGRLIFYRCKPVTNASDEPGVVNGMLTREMTSSLSYYNEKLEGDRIDTLLVRSTGEPVEDVVARLGTLNIGSIEPIDPVASVELGEGVRLDVSAAQQIAPAIGAAVGR